MKFTIKIILVIMSLTWFSNSHAEDVNYTLITSENQLVDGGLYFITYKYSSNYYHTLNYSLFNESVDSVYQFTSNAYYDNTYTSVSSIINNTTIFKIIKKDEHWFMINTGNNRYVGEQTEIISSPYLNLSLHSKYPNEDFYITFDGSNLKIGGKYFAHYSTSANYQMKSKISANETVLLYKIDDNNYGKKIDAKMNLSSINYTGNITFDRDFFDGNYNTLVLPFKVTNYKEVFGNGTTVYKLVSSTENSISFSKISDDDTIQADKPYLIKGTFFKNPYVIANTTINYDGNSKISTTIGDVTFNGVYNTTDVGGTNAFILYKDVFYSCSKTSKMEINPYKWYITTKSTSIAAKKLLIDDSDTSTGINQMASENGSKDIYNMQGMKVQTDWNSLTKGIYIVNKKKVVKK